MEEGHAVRKKHPKMRIRLLSPRGSYPEAGFQIGRTRLVSNDELWFLAIEIRSQDNRGNSLNLVPLSAA
jgi:hypothetical protein